MLGLEQRTAVVGEHLPCPISLRRSDIALRASGIPVIVRTKVSAGITVVKYTDMATKSSANEDCIEEWCMTL